LFQNDSNSGRVERIDYTIVFSTSGKLMEVGG